MTSCEMCGKESDLVLAELEGVNLNVCSNCAKFGKIKRRNSAFGPNSSNSFKRSFVQPEGPEFVVVDNCALLIRSAREGSQLTQEDFARMLNEKESQIHKWESGALKPSVDVAKKIGRILGLSLVKQEEVSTAKLEPVKRTDEFTLGDFIKVRKRN